jgi:MFS family permease
MGWVAIVLQALRLRDFRLLWAGGLVSSLGSWLLTLAIPTHIFLVTASLRATGLTVAAEYLPLLILGPVAGVFADRWDRRRLLIGTNLFCAGAVSVMLLGLAPGRTWVLYAALVAENADVVLNLPAWQARTPAIVGTGSLLSSANALNSVSSGTVRLIGGPFGAVLLTAWGANWLIGIDAVSYLLAAAAMFMISAAVGEPEDRGTITVVGIARDLRAGARVLWRQPVARVLLPVTVIFLAANASLGAVLIVSGIQRLGGSEHTGFLLAGLGVGFLVGAPVVRRLLDRVQPGPLLAATLTATAAAFAALFTSSSLTRATCRGRCRRVRLHVAGGPADDHAAGHPERRPRPHHRGLPHRRGGRRPGRCRGRPRPGPGGRPHRHRRRGQPGHPGRGRGGPAQCPENQRSISTNTPQPSYSRWYRGCARLSPARAGPAERRLP